MDSSSQSLRGQTFLDLFGFEFKIPNANSNDPSEVVKSSTEISKLRCWGGAPAGL